jgi:transposase-like protein
MAETEDGKSGQEGRKPRKSKALEGKNAELENISSAVNAELRSAERRISTLENENAALENENLRLHAMITELEAMNAANLNQLKELEEMKERRKHAGRPAKYTEEQQQQALELAVKGADSYSAIARKTGMSKAAVAALISKNGISKERQIQEALKLLKGSGIIKADDIL